MTRFMCHACHSEIDQGARLTKAERRTKWVEAAVKTWIWLIETGKVRLA